MQQKNAVSKQKREQRINHKTKILMEQRTMSHRTSEEYICTNREITKEIRTHNRQQNMKKIENPMKQNKSLKILRRRTAIGKRDIQNIKNTQGNIITRRNKILQAIE